MFTYKICVAVVVAVPMAIALLASGPVYAKAFGNTHICMYVLVLVL